MVGGMPGTLQRRRTLLDHADPLLAVEREVAVGDHGAGRPSEHPAKVRSNRADTSADRPRRCLVGATLLVIGVFGFVAAAVVSKRAYAPAQPGGAGSSDVPKDVPKWIPGVYIGSLVIAIIGLLVIIFDIIFG
jgi:hypothetical protein